MWVPTLLRNAGVRDLGEIGWRTSLIFVAGAVGMAAIGWSSDRNEERRWHLIGSRRRRRSVLSASAFGRKSERDDPDPGDGLGDHLRLPGAVLDRADGGAGKDARAGGHRARQFMGASGSALSPAFVGWMKVLTGSLFGAIAVLASLFLASLVYPG